MKNDIKPFLKYISETNNKTVPDSEDIEAELVDNVESANTEDLKEYPGKRGETAHNTLHSTIKRMINKMRSMGHK